MKKGLIILTGDISAKNLFQEKLKERYWVWNVSTLNFIRHTATALGWEFTDDIIAEEFIHKLLKLSNEYLDYEYNYVVKFMKKLNESTKAEENNKEGDLLIAHVNKDLADRLQDEFSFFNVHVTNGGLVKDNFKDGRFVIGLDSSKEDFKKAVEEVLNIVCVNK